MAITATYFALGDLLLEGVKAVRGGRYQRYSLLLFAPDVIEFEYDPVILTTVHTRMLQQVLLHVEPEHDSLVGFLDLYLS